MSRRPYPDRNKALHQLWRHGPRRPAAANVMVTLASDASPFLTAVRQAQANLVFDWHPDLQEINGTLDNLYPEMNE
ncbi:hypothetical protein F7Q99_20110 [Streptomyces kaniharaensis]|uniref:Uncharacterized protein n=1 Tax=Streptomyces kaniharaensis TaxID=212423 RepID=A0A6N7KSC1_9ACTN|nr:hypothetical protein [Streptomyces kaniharaensis]MQS14506.1 hypothetical protein [Streptomyces kaniharaensis]